MIEGNEGDSDSGTASASKVPAPPNRRARHFFLTFGANLGIMGLTFATGTLNARLLGPSGRGELAAIQNIPAYLGALASLGLPAAVGYYTARRPGEARALVVTGSGLCLAASLPAILIGYLVMPWALSSQPARVVHDARLYLSFVALQAVNVIPYVALQGLRQFDVWNMWRMAPNVASLLAILAAWLLRSPHAGTVARGYLMTYALIAPFVYLTLWSRSSPGVARTGSHVRDLFRYGLPNAVTAPAGLLNLQLDQMLLAAWLPSNLLGLYAVGVSWSALSSPIFSALGSVIFPTLASVHDVNEQRIMVSRALRLAILVVIVLGVGLAAVTPLLLPLLFGAPFRGAVPPALVLVGAGMLLNLNNLCAEILRGMGVPRWTMYSQFAALPVTIVSLLVLLPRWSIIGAAVSSILAYAVVEIVCLVGISNVCGLKARELFPRKADCIELLGLVRRYVPFLRQAT